MYYQINIFFYRIIAGVNLKHSHTIHCGKLTTMYSMLDVIRNNTQSLLVHDIIELVFQHDINFVKHFAALNMFETIYASNYNYVGEDNTSIKFWAMPFD